MATRFARSRDWVLSAMKDESDRNILFIMQDSLANTLHPSVMTWLREREKPKTSAGWLECIALLEKLELNVIVPNIIAPNVIAPNVIAPRFQGTMPLQQYDSFLRVQNDELSNVFVTCSAAIDASLQLLLPRKRTEKHFVFTVLRGDEAVGAIHVIGLVYEYVPTAGGKTVFATLEELARSLPALCL